MLGPKLPSFHPRAVEQSIPASMEQRNRLTGPPIFGTPAPLFCRIGRLFSLCVPSTIGTPDPTTITHSSSQPQPLSLASIHARSLLEVFSCSNLWIRPCASAARPPSAQVEREGSPLAMFPGASMAS